MNIPFRTIAAAGLLALSIGATAQTAQTAAATGGTLD